MFHAKNYETMSTFGKVMQRKLVASFFPHTVYVFANVYLHKRSVITIINCGHTCEWTMVPVDLRTLQCTDIQYMQGKERR